MFDLQSPAALSHISPSEVPQQGAFEALDGHEVRVNGRICHVEVCGVFDDGSRRWVQLAIEGDSRQLLTVQLDEAGLAESTSVVY